MRTRQVVCELIVVAGLHAGCATPAPGDWTPGAPPELLQHVPPELRYVRVDLPPEHNGFARWMEAAAKLVPPSEPPGLKDLWDDFRNSDGPFPGGEEGRLLAGHLDRNRAALSQLAAAARSGRWQTPPVTNGSQFDYAYLRTLKDFMNYMDAEARRELSKGSPEAAARSILDTLRAGECVLEADGGILDILVGKALQESACAGLLRLAERDDIPVSTWASAIDALSPRPQASASAARALRVELCCELLNHLESAGRFRTWCNVGRVKPVDPALPEEIYRGANLPGTIRLLSEFIRRWMGNLLRPWPERDRDLADDWRKMHIALDFNARMKDWTAHGLQTSEDVVLAKLLLAFGRVTLGSMPKFTSDDKVLWDQWEARIQKQVDRAESLSTSKADSLLLARLVVTIWAAGMETYVESFHGMLAEREGARLVVALRMYVARKGRLPAALQDLVDEKILSAVPTDPFSGKPMRYSAERRIVWSVGPDEVDDGGDGDPDWRRMGKDYVWQVPGAKN
jgi:hypothetical protein